MMDASGGAFESVLKSDQAGIESINVAERIVTKLHG